MNSEIMFSVLLWSNIMLICLNWIYFFDWLQIIGKIVSLISPHRKIKEIEDNCKLRKKMEYKRHKTKWKLRFLLAPISFSGVYLMLYYLTRGEMIVSYFVGMIIIVVIYRVLSRYEIKERNNISSSTGDSSVC